VRAGPVDDVTLATLEAHVVHNVATGATISTDEWGGYNSLATKGYVHGTVNHKSEVIAQISVRVFKLRKGGGGLRG